MVRLPTRAVTRLFDLSSVGRASASMGSFSDAITASSGPLLGIDVGTRHIGVAMSDKYRQISFSHCGFRRGDMVEDIERFRSVTRGSGITAAVVGMPIAPTGKDCGKLQSFIRAYAEGILKECGIGIICYWDESYSTNLAAERFDRGTKRSHRKRRGLRKRTIDAVSRKHRTNS